jgi:phosphate transport system substrate-binding protein
VKSTLAFAAAVVIAACSPDGDRQSGSAAGTTRSSGSGVDLTGAGATFPYPLYSKWMSDYAAQTGVKINYQSIGSGGGIRQLSESTVDFGASDSPMTDEEMRQAKGGQILHIPMVMGAVVVAYNVPGVSAPLKLSGDVVADIFLGRIRKWNDPRVTILNPGARLPDDDVLVVRRSDGSGTTYIFSDYLSAVSRAWKDGPGRGKELRWPTGIGAKGNEGIAGQIKQTPGSIGYVELAYAKQNGLSVAALQNSSGVFVQPTVESVTAAAAGILDTLAESSDYRITIVNPPGANAYPIASFTWMLLYQTQPDARKGRQLVEYLTWALRQGDAAATALDYAPLPAELDARLIRRLQSVRIGPQP